VDIVALAVMMPAVVLPHPRRWNPVERWPVVFPAAITLLVAVAGCAASTGQSGGSMMGGSSYHYSHLTCSAPSSLPGATITVREADMGMTQMMTGAAPQGAHMTLQATPATAAAGQVSIVVSNTGWRTHELVVLPLAAGASAGHRIARADGRVSETGSLGDASASCARGAGHGITAGTVSWTTLTLARGHYELLSNLANQYADGMHAELTVT
jgi:uncharacterized cupredoxin-like copper-binding protein